jgi:hypothetical protein
MRLKVSKLTHLPLLVSFDYILRFQIRGQYRSIGSRNHLVDELNTLAL